MGIQRIRFGKTQTTEVKKAVVAKKEEKLPTTPKLIVPPKPEPKPVPVAVDGDDDNDGVKNSVDRCPDTPSGFAVDTDGCIVSMDLKINFEFDSYKVKSTYHEVVNKLVIFYKKVLLIMLKYMDIQIVWVVKHTTKTYHKKEQMLLKHYL